MRVRINDAGKAKTPKKDNKAARHIPKPTTKQPQAKLIKPMLTKKTKDN